MKQQQPSFVGLIALCLFLPIMIPILALVFVRRVVLAALKWSFE